MLRSVPSGWFIGCALRRALRPGISKGIYFLLALRYWVCYSYVRLRSARIFLNVPPRIFGIIELKEVWHKKVKWAQFISNLKMWESSCVKMIKS